MLDYTSDIAWFAGYTFHLFIAFYNNINYTLLQYLGLIDVVTKVGWRIPFCVRITGRYLTKKISLRGES